jgi:hypothetical protein
LLTTLRRLAAGGAPTTELIVHPGAGPDPDRARYAWRYLWEQEMSALTDDSVRRAVTMHGFSLGTFGSL